MKSRKGLGIIFSHSFLLRTAPHYLNAWNTLHKQINGPYILTIILTIAYLQFMPKSFQTYCPIISMVFKDRTWCRRYSLRSKTKRANSASLYLVSFTWRWENVTTPRSILGSDANMEGYCLQRSCSLVVNNVSFLILILIVSNSCKLT